MFDKPEKFEHDAEVWRDQAEGFAKAAEAAAAIAKDTATAASEAVWKGPMPTERLTRMQEQALDAANSADVLATMAQACRAIADAAEDATKAIDELRREWDDGNIVERIRSDGDDDDVRGEFNEKTSTARALLSELADDLQPVIDRGDPLDYLFNPIQVPGAPISGEQLDDKAANDYFETGVLADPEHVEEIEDTINGLSEGEDPPENWNEWATANGYTSEEIQAALDNLDPDERAALDEWLAANKGDINNDDTDPNPASLGLTSFLWQNMRADQIQEFHDDVPNLEPTLYGDADGWVNGDVDMSVDFDITDGGSGVVQIDQGSIGECATLASIAAAVAADPGWVDKHIKQNPNGTFTVTIYDENGNPVEVTVNGNVPADGGNPIFNGRDSDGEINWASIYEKAMAQYQGGHYEEIDGAYTAERVSETSGQDNNVVELPLITPWHLATFAQMQEAFENGKPIIMGGGGHAYAVVGFEDGKVLVQNPWGGEGSVVAMTPEEFNSGQFPEPADDWPEFSYVAVTE
ncbi:C2 family cysteine protease [Haloactinopolyspora sp.]|uniref:C2 family cysteine protease n=1 Tax=Haloactinopolyspora sp. TaxID=1966353 RepID=UPI0026049A6C|nr:C2 family cysteine protease [Haloactinopolyspora sp.]